MVSHRAGLVERQYAASGADIAFEAIMAEHPPLDDEGLADLIEVDGRARIAIGREVDLRRYLGAVHDLESRPVPLDAAIDVALRWLSASSRPSKAAVERLVARHPSLAASIQAAASLGRAMWSTTGLRTRLGGPERALPSEFGPRTPSGGQRYELRTLLGSGGWGEVYLALDRQLSDSGHEALVAIKVLTGFDRSAWARQRLIDEAAKARRVEHANVVRVLDRGVSDDDEDYLVYEYVPGGDLAAWLEDRERWPRLRAAVALVAKIARGVQAAHAAGLVHCDLKPGNVLLSAEGEPRVTDFGIAVRAGERPIAPGSGDDGEPIGNLAFISPEQYRAEAGSLSVASDVYALGGILYYLVTRRLPNGDSAGTIARNHALEGGRTEPPSMHGQLAWLERDLDRIGRRAMAMNPAARHASASAVADDLEAWLRREPVYWTQPGAGRRTMLWCWRSPIASALIVLTVAAGSAGTALSVHWSGVAAKETKKASRATSIMSLATGLILERTKEAKRAYGEGSLLDATPAALAAEWITGEVVRGDPDAGLRARWVRRSETVRSIIDSRVQNGFGDSFEVLLWESTLALFELRKGEYAKAEPLLESNLQRWREALQNSNDPWIGQVEKMLAVARVQRLKGAPGTGDRLAEMEEAWRVLAPALKVDRDMDARAPIQQLALGAIKDLCGPSMLDYPDAAVEAAERFEAVPRKPEVMR